MKLLRPYQEKAIASLRASLLSGNRRPVLQLPTGCHEAGTMVLLHDGSSKPVEDIVVGDKLMGPDSNPRTVLSLARGRDEMFRITPLKYSRSFVVNAGHILSLVETQTGKITNLSVRDWLSRSKNFKNLNKLRRVGVDFVGGDGITTDPYVLGIWLGDGTSDSPAITTMDQEAIDAFCGYAQSLGCSIRVNSSGGTRCPTYSARTDRGKPNPFLSELRTLGVIGDKRIPKAYLTASRKIRMELLAGILDADGYTHNGFCEIIQKRSGLSDDICFLARSLGFAVSRCNKTVNGGIYQSMNVCGDLSLIPFRIDRRKPGGPRKQIKSVLRSGFSVESVGQGDFYGFHLSGDHLY